MSAGHMGLSPAYLAKGVCPYYALYMSNAYDKSGVANHDAATTDAWGDFMSTGWAPSPLEGLKAEAVVPYAKARREKLSAL